MFQFIDDWWNKITTKKQNNSSIPESTSIPTQYDCAKSGHAWTDWKTIVDEPHGYSFWRLIEKRQCKACKKIDVSGGVFEIKDKRK